MTLAPGASEQIPITTGAVNFRRPGRPAVDGHSDIADQFGRAGQRHSRPHHSHQPGNDGPVQPGLADLPQPGHFRFLLLVKNTGNLQDSYTATITGTTGPITASLTGLDGQPTQTIPIHPARPVHRRHPAPDRPDSAVGPGTVTVEVQSLSNPNETATARATVSTPVTATPIQPVIQLAANPGSTTTYGQSVSFTATVGPPASGDPTPTGSVQFQIDGSNFGTAVTLDNGSATSDAISTLTAVGHTITALYSGDPTYAQGSQTLTQTVNPATPTVNVRAPNAMYNAAPTML